MQELFSLPSRQYNNRTLETGLIRLSDHIDVSTLGGILVRWEIEEIDAAGSVTVAYAMYNDGVYVGGVTKTYTEPGRYPFGFSRSDFDDTTTVEATLQVAGRARLYATVYSIGQGEDIPEWL